MRFPVARAEPWLPRTAVIGAAIAALGAVLAANPARAQEGAPAAGDDSTQAARRAGGGPGDSAAKPPAAAAPDETAPMGGNIEPVASRHGLASLQRRANIKTLIAKTPIASAAVKTAGSPATGHTRILPSPLRPAIEAAAPRNAIGAAMPGLRPPGRGQAGVMMFQPGTGMTGLGAAAGTGGAASRQIAVPTNAGLALRGAAISGTAMRRVASGPGSIGGPAKDHSGINGTLMKPRH